MKNLSSYDIYNESVSSQIENILKSKLRFIKQRRPNSGFTYGNLKQVYNRGYDAWKENPKKGFSPHIWALKRVNSFLTNGMSWKDLDKDIAERVVKAAKKQVRKKYFGKYEL